MAKSRLITFHGDEGVAAQLDLGPRDTQVLVVGLGRFGSSVAKTLTQLHIPVLGVDEDSKIVQQYADELLQCVQIDSTKQEALKQIGADEFERAVVAIGVDVEASILTTAALLDVGVNDVWAKANSEAHGKILERIGAQHVVYPEHDMGERVGHLLTGRMLDYIEIDDNFALIELMPPKDIIGKTLLESDLRNRFGVTVVSIKPVGESFTYTQADTIVREGDLLLVAGETNDVEKFSEHE